MNVIHVYLSVIYVQFHSYNIVMLMTFYTSETMLYPDDAKSFLESDVAKRCQELALRPPNEIGANLFYDITDFILMRIVRTNALRPKAIRNITEHHVNRAKVTDDGKAVISVCIITDVLTM